MALTPYPGLHATHRRAHHEAKMVDPEVLAHEPLLRGHHVVVIVVGKLHVQAVAGLARFSMPDAVREDDEILRRVKQLSRSEQNVCKAGIE